MKRALLILLLQGCATVRVIDVAAPPSLENYPSAEFSFNQTRYVGLGAASVEKGTSLSVLNLEIQGYLDGTVNVVSKACKVDLSRTYLNNAVVQVPISGDANESCVFSILVLPKSDVAPIKPLKGEFLLKVVPTGKTWQGRSLKLPDGEDQLVETIFPSENEALATLAGCGRTAETFKLPSEGGTAIISTHEFLVDDSPRRCFVEGVFKNDEYKTLTTWQIWRHSSDYVPLPDPDIYIEESLFGDHLVSATDENVFATIWDGAVTLGPRASVPFEPEKNYVIRLITTSGRTLVCTWQGDSRRYFCLR